MCSGNIGFYPMHYKQLDGLRFVAVLAVIFHHTCTLPVLSAFNLGAFGVNLFFVISGFLISEILIREKIKKTDSLRILKIFFTRRALRIFPLYYLYIVICLFIVPHQTHEYIAWLLTYSINLWITLKNTLAFWYFTHLWSLGVEEQFYLFWPFLIILFPLKRLKLWFSIMIIVSIIYRAINTFYLSGYELFNYTMLPTTLDCFGAGALLAYLKTFTPRQLNKALKHKYLIIIGILLFVANNKFGTTLSQQALGKTLNAFIAFYLVGIASTIRFDSGIKKILENKLITYFGKISYGLYIYHLLVWGMAGEILTQFWKNLNLFQTNSPMKMFVEFIFILIITIIVSTISYELFEKRILFFRKYFRYSATEIVQTHKSV